MIQQKNYFFKRNNCQSTETTQIQTEYNSYYSKLIIQRRVTNISGLEKFKNVLNLCT